MCGICNAMVRGDTFTFNVRLDRRSYDGLIVKVTNISDNDLKHRVLVGRPCDYLTEVRRDIKKMLSVEVILITSTDES